MFRLDNRNDDKTDNQHPWNHLSLWELIIGFFILGLIIGFIRLFI
jgi:hypothetical protein